MSARASPLLCDHHHPIKGGGESQVAEAEALKFGSELALFPLSVCSPASQHWNPYPRGKQCWNKRGWHGCSACVSVQAVVFWLGSDTWTASNVLPVKVPVMASPTPLRHCFGSEPPLSLTDEPPFGLCHPGQGVELCHETSRTQVVIWLRLGCALGRRGKPASHLCSLNPPSPPCFRSKQVCAPHEWSSGFLQSFC